MKKLLAFVLVLTFFCTAVFANTDVFTEVGIKIDCQETFNKSAGTIFLQTTGIISHKPFISALYMGYTAIPKEKIDTLSSTAFGSLFVLSQTTFSMLVVATDGSINDVLSKVNSKDISRENFTEFGSVDGYKFYYAPVNDEEALDRIEQKYRDDLEKVNAAFINDLKKAELFAPVNPYEKMIGQTISFDAVTLDGEKLSSRQLFAANKITMVNMWGTWCHNCVNEMDELAELHKKFQAKGCGIIGVESENNSSDSTFQSARDLLREKGVTYPNVIMPEKAGEVLEAVTAYPTSFFVDSQGKILTYPIIGAAVKDYEPTLDKLLAGDSVDVVSNTGASGNDGDSFRVYVLDGDKNPVKGAVVQFCDDATCNIGKTDAKGLAVFNMPAGKVYDIHLLKVPAGFKMSTDSYKTLDVYSDVVIHLPK
ncbi:MAG: TlpA family protein disulfide reductase [Synergistaceae bacterium]|nr:TlpA family protein disulfide reductase [Synergistaceae bacterium]MBQ3399418.1 TlpA family protein disulfide reductase [Synergistaceae bacterium]MBQ4400781.1 TlpA family protein disulfide reductase [Synergistaceae bacterium]MBQ6417916.1 TlpA family protein disulfide reductase [Synergistaceae bacterium]MBQ6664657.1 TlpA family protein disulfide reductase [Synergistaceae bacterium]